LIREEARKPFDLTSGPPLRAALVALCSEEHVLLVSMNQIACDGWSSEIFFRELSRLYQSYCTGSPSELAEPPVQYADFAVWQTQWLQRDEAKSQFSYWRRQLGNGLAVLRLPTDRPRPALASFRGARQLVLLSERLTEALRKLSRVEGATLFMTLLAAFNTLLHRYTDEEDIAVGCPVDNRRLPEIANLIGSFVNTLVLRNNLSGAPAFRDLLFGVRNTCIDAYAHQELPFEKLVEELRPQRDLSRNPLFQVMFAFQKTSVPTLDLPGVQSVPLAIDAGAAKFDLTVSLVEKEREVAGYFEYNTDLFDHSTVERMIGHFQTLLKGIVADPDRSISTLPLLTKAERHRILEAWNDTQADYPKDSCIHELFEAQAERTPEATAVEFEGKQLTYRELNARANQLAHYLRSLGIGPETVVGICVERSLEVVVALLGVLKAGGSYLPLDPAYPSERLEFMMADAQISVLLTQKDLVDPLTSILDRRSLKAVCIDQDWQAMGRNGTANSQCLAKAENLAYVIYTSGSTGRAKGVQVEHRSLVNCLQSMRRRLELTERDVLLAVTTISFDIAALEIYLPLITGAKVVLANREEAMDGKQLSARLAGCQATAMQATPSGWEVLLDAGWEGSANFKMFCGGENLSRRLADRLLDHGASLWNLYGPTETTIWSTLYRVKPGEGPVPIGRPIENTQVYLLDSQFQPVPIGVPGEIYIGGAGVARDYLNRAELSSEKFVPNPFSSEPAARLYRTGDRARYLPDGNIEFLGRFDNQVKIRGYRIEPEEIQTALNQHPSVRESVVLAQEDAAAEGAVAENPRSDPQLVAYVVPKVPETLPVGDLRSFLKGKLPDYMVPSLFVPLESLPLTPSGKLDRQALPQPDGARRQFGQRFVGPRTEIENLVAQVWREVLKLENIGVHDNFFDLGGHSLLATRLIARLRADFGVDLPLRKLFEAPTTAGLAGCIDLLRRNRSGVGVPPIVPVPRDRPIPLSFSQRRLWFLQSVDPSLTAYNMPAAFRIKGRLSIPALEQALNEIVNRHEVLRTRMVEVEGEWVQQIVSLTVTLPVTDLAHLAEDGRAVEVRRLAAEDARRPYNLHEAPLMRANLLRLGDREHLLILNFHHIVSDGSSLAIFYEELAALYEAFAGGKVSPLPPLPVQYADYAVWQNEWLQGEVLASQLAYWKRQLRDASPVNLFSDHTRPPAQTFRGARLIRALSEELTKALKNLSRREGVTLFMTLLASLDIVLSRHAGQEDIIVGSTIAGRNRPEVDSVIGFFINALALRVDLSGNPSFLTLLKRVREVCLDAYSHQDVPFERVVEAINPERDLSRNPLFQIMFNMADTSERVFTLPGCETTKLSHSTPGAKFDMILHAPEKDGRIELSIVYNTDLFSPDRMAATLEQFIYLLSQIVENPEQRIGRYSLAPPSARALLPDPAEPLDETWEGAIHTLFSRQAERVPDRLAVIDPKRAWTYAELDARSNQLAHCLMARGIEPGDLVAIYAQRSSALVLALLGILKAGASFAILDPAYPAARLISCLRTAPPRGWLQIDVEGDLSADLQSHLDGLSLCCRLSLSSGKPVELALEYPETDPGVSVEADDSAYVAFTSGSTGEPKGVLCRHGPVTHFLPWLKETFDLSETDRFGLLSGLSYSLLHRDIFTALFLAAPLYIPDPRDVRSPERLTAWLREKAITILHLTPALGQLLQTSPERTLPSVRRVFFAGDVLTRQDANRIRRLAPNAKITNVYGATETQRAVGYFEIPAQAASWSGAAAKRPIPLGHGVKDVQLLLLTPGRNLAGIGELGELYVRSPHLAAGYIGDSALTREMFSVNPFTGKSGDRLYRTGELGRYRRDGNVEWAGRKDRCVNIRGFRVEPAEIESVLRQHPAVKDVAATVKEFVVRRFSPTSTSEPRLVAYIVPGSDQPPSSDEMRCFLRARFPDFMVPSHFFFLERLPVSPNGKIDYRSLPSADQLMSRSETPPVEGCTYTERALSHIFAEALGLDRVDLHENFFHIGGHSLLGARVAVRVRETFGVALELRAFFEAPTVASLARQIEALLQTAKPTRDPVEGEREEIEL
jgi:amino acid adenylation domain-containing protein